MLRKIVLAAGLCHALAVLAASPYCDKTATRDEQSSCPIQHAGDLTPIPDRASEREAREAGKSVCLDPRQHPSRTSIQRAKNSVEQCRPPEHEAPSARRAR